MLSSKNMMYNPNSSAANNVDKDRDSNNGMLLQSNASFGSIDVRLTKYSNRGYSMLMPGDYTVM